MKTKAMIQAIAAVVSICLAQTPTSAQAFDDYMPAQKYITAEDSPWVVGVRNSVVAPSIAPPSGFFIVLSGADATLMAGNIIRLKPGFHAQAGSRFRAKIDASLRSSAFADDALSRATDITENLKQIPTQFALAQNYPNPFNPTTSIRYDLPASAFVKLYVFDMLGRTVNVLVNEQRAAGSYEARFNAANLSSGTYFYRLQAGEFVQTKKMFLVK